MCKRSLSNNALIPLLFVFWFRPVQHIFFQLWCGRCLYVFINWKIIRRHDPEHPRGWVNVSSSRGGVWAGCLVSVVWVCNLALDSKGNLNFHLFNLCIYIVFFAFQNTVKKIDVLPIYGVWDLTFERRPFVREKLRMNRTFAQVYYIY